MVPFAAPFRNAGLEQPFKYKALAERLPIAQAADPGVQRPGSAPAGPQCPHADRDPMLRLVVADDHPLFLSGVTAVLEAAKFQVAAAVTNGKEALAAIEQHDPEVVVLDVKMPELAGLSALSTLRAKGDNRPVILLTAQLNDAELLTALKSGVNGILSKQGGSRKLLDAIEIVCKGGQAIAPDLIARALKVAQHSSSKGGLACLSPRELALAKSAGTGLRNRVIAEQMGMTEGATKVALHRLYEKLGVTNRTELALLVRSNP